MMALETSAPLSKYGKPVRAPSLGYARTLCQRWGMSPEEYIAHIVVWGNSGTRRSPMEAFLLQRTQAFVRGIAWEISFPEWWALWQPHWARRGVRRDNFVMARNGDVGPYAARNVQIKTAVENLRESNRLNPRPQQFKPDTTHCYNGHPVNAENRRYAKNGGVRCKACALDRQRVYRERVRTGQVKAMRKPCGRRAKADPLTTSRTSEDGRR